MTPLLALLAALQAAPAVAAPPPPPPPAEDKAVELAGAFIVNACMLRLDAAGSAAEYGAGSAEVGRKFKVEYPETANVPVDLDDGPKHDSCRVAYHGPHVSELWTLFTKPPAICAIASRSDNDIAMTCPASKDNVSAAIALHRAGGPAGGVFSETMTWLGPSLP